VKTGIFFQIDLVTVTRFDYAQRSRGLLVYKYYLFSAKIITALYPL